MRTDGIKQKVDVEKLKHYFLSKNDFRNYVLVVMGLNTALRCSDVLALTWNDVFDFETGKFRKHLIITEKKTKKITKIRMNKAIIDSLKKFMKFLGKVCSNQVLFKSQKGENKAISRVQMYRIIKKAAKILNIEGNIGCHSLRKTFGYNAFKGGVSPIMLMEVFNHSSFAITRRYLGIDQDERDKVFLEIIL